MNDILRWEELNKYEIEDPSAPNSFSKKAMISSLSVITCPLNSIAGNLPDLTFSRNQLSFWP